MTSLFHLLDLLRALLSRRERLTLEKRRLEEILHRNGMSRARSKQAAWEFFNDPKGKP